MGTFISWSSRANFAPYNLVPAFTDTLIPLWLLGLLYAYHRAGGLEGALRRET